MQWTRILPVVGMFFCLSFCTSGPPNTRSVSTENDFGERESYFVHRETGEREGQYTRYNAAGTLLEEAIYYNGQYHGQRILYYANGDTQTVETYQHGQFIGPWRTYYPNGNLELAGQYQNNRMEGIWKGYYETGELFEVVTFKDNQENGPFTEYYKDGTVQVKGTYRDGDHEHGALFFYDADGQLTKKMNCDMGLCRTEWSRATGDPMK